MSEILKAGRPTIERELGAGGLAMVHLGHDLDVGGRRVGGCPAPSRGPPVCATMSGHGVSNYAASKAGIIAFTKALAQEVGRKGITVNAIAPGFLDVGMGERLSSDVVKAVSRRIAQSKFGTAYDVANAVVCLASEAAGYITGDVLSIDGGII